MLLRLLAQHIFGAIFALVHNVHAFVTCPPIVSGKFISDGNTLCYILTSVAGITNRFRRHFIVVNVLRWQDFQFQCSYAQNYRTYSTSSLITMVSDL